MICFCAVRLTEGLEWLDIGTIYPLLDHSRKLADATDQKIPQWAEHNPVVRFATVTIAEK